jgi:ParB family transcriptional regulator, chromosome partitioning protein
MNANTKIVPVVKDVASESIESDVILINYQKLRLWSGNMRKSATSKQADEQLYAAIKEAGRVLSPLLVFVEDGLYQVAGGGRRWRQVGRLIADGFFSENVPVPCTVIDKAKAVVYTLYENTYLPPHPADLYDAYQQMIIEGLSQKDICKAFGQKPKEVEKLLRLSVVHPEIMNNFRSGKFELDVMMAFTIADNQEKQLACWQSMNKKNIHASAVRQFLTKSSYDNSDAIVKSVGVDVYKKAGGGITEDIFSKIIYLHDMALVETLFNEKIELLAEELKSDGWLWVEHRENFYGHAGSQYTKISADYVNVPESLQAEIDALRAKIDELEDSDNYDEHEQEIDDLNEKLDALHGSKNEYLAYTADEKALAGVILSLENNGSISFHRGYVKKEHQKQLEINSGDGDAKKNNASESGESAKLKMDLDRYYTQAVRASLVDKPELCFDLLIFEMALGYFANNWSRFVKASFSGTGLDAVELDSTAAASKIESARERLNLAWVEVEDEVECFDEFLKLTQSEKMAIMAYCVAVNVDADIHRPEAHQVYAENQTAFNLLDYWKPTEANYFNRLNKSSLAKIGTAALGDEWAEAAAKRKRGDISKELANSDKLVGWLPSSLIRSSDEPDTDTEEDLEDPHDWL